MVRKCVRTKQWELWVDQGIQQVLLLWIPLDDPPSWETEGVLSWVMGGGVSHMRVFWLALRNQKELSVFPACTWDWREGSAVKNTSCSEFGPRVWILAPMSVSHSLLQLQLQGTQQALVASEGTGTHTCTQVHMHKYVFEKRRVWLWSLASLKLSGQAVA